MSTITIIGSNGMLSEFLTTSFMNDGNIVNVYGLETPNNYKCSSFTTVDLLRDKFNYEQIVKSDVVVYAAGAGVQAALKTDSSLMYAMNLSVPIEITLQLQKHGYVGTYISFGSYMEIGINNEEGKRFVEEDVVLSGLPVTNDYALSKRLYGRYINDLCVSYTYWHFILPNMFSYNDFKPGTRLIPYTLQYLQSAKLGKEVEEPSFSAGTQMREFILMEDIAIVLRKSFAAKMQSGIYNVAGGEFMSIRNLIERMFSAYGIECKDSFFGKEQRRDGDIKSLCLNGNKLLQAIDYLPKTILDDVLKQTM